MDVDEPGHAEAVVAEDVGHVLEGDAGGSEEAGGGVPEVVGAEPLEAGALGDGP